MLPRSTGCLLRSGRPALGAGRQLCRWACTRTSAAGQQRGKKLGGRLLMGGSLCAASQLVMHNRAFGSSQASVLSSQAAAAAGSAAPKGPPLGDLPVTIYQYKICPFCCKVKAVLDFFKVPYETLDVNPLTKAEIKFSPDYRKVPIARLGEEVVNDSSAIVNRVAELLRARGAGGGKKELDRFFSDDAQKWATWADTKLAVLLFPNITRSFGESYQAFSYVQEVPHFSAVDKWSNQLVGATAMWAAQGKLKKKYGIEDERKALFGAIEEWVAEVGEKPFVGGPKPNLGDLAVYACIRAIDGFDAHKDLLANTAIQPWYRRVEQAIGESTCLKAE